MASWMTLGRGVLETGVIMGGSQCPKIHIGVADVFAEFARQAGNFIGAPITAIYGFQQLPFGDYGNVNILFDDARDFIKCG